MKDKKFNQITGCSSADVTMTSGRIKYYLLRSYSLNQIKFLKIIILILFIGFVLLSNAAYAGYYDHYSPAIWGIRDFFVPEKPGFYYAIYNYYYTSDDFLDESGDSIDHFQLDTSRSRTRNQQRIISTPYGNVTIDASASANARLRANADIDLKFDNALIVPTAIYVSDWKILGASYAAYLAVPFAYVRLEADLDAQLKADLGIDSTISFKGPGGGFIERNFTVPRSFSRDFHKEVDDSQFNISDICIQPIWLGWNKKHFSASLAYALYAATGKFDSNDIDNTGMGFWTNQFQAAGAWYPWENKGTALTVTTTYELNSDMRDIDVTPGAHFTLNYGLSQFLPLNKKNTLLAEIGVKGYNSWQVSDDHGSDATNTGVHDRVYGIGAQLGLTSVKYDASIVLNGTHQYQGLDIFEGDYIGINFAKKF